VLYESQLYEVAKYVVIKFNEIVGEKNDFPVILLKARERAKGERQDALMSG